MNLLTSIAQGFLAIILIIIGFKVILFTAGLAFHLLYWIFVIGLIAWIGNRIWRFTTQN